MAKPGLIYNPLFLVFNNLGTLAPGSLVYTYAAGTSTLLATYTDATLATQNPNPMTVNSAGYLPNLMYGTAAYKLVATSSTDTVPPTNPYWTWDNLQLLPQTTATTYKNVNYTVQVTDRDKVILCDGSTGAITQTLLAGATAGDGFVIQFKKIDSSANAITIQTSGSDTIDGSSTIILRNQNDYVWIVNEGGTTAWYTGRSTPQAFRDSNGNIALEINTVNNNINTLTVQGGAGGVVTSATMTNRGSYTASTIPTVSITGGSGTGATATAVLGYPVSAITVTNNGSGYTSLPTISIAAPATNTGGTTATGALTMGVTGETIVSGGGSTYAINNVLTVVGGTGTAATLTVNTVSGGVITGATVTTSGAYTALPTNPVSVTGGGGSGATFNLTYDVLSTSVSTAGSGYTSSPAVTISGGGGSSAAATTTLGTTGTIAYLNITSGGNSYTSTPTIGFSSGTAAATAVLNQSNPTIGAAGTSTNSGIGLQTEGTGAVTLYGNATAAANLQFYEQTTNGTMYVGFQAPATITSNVQWTLPGADATISQQPLVSNAAGILAFSPVALATGTTIGQGMRTGSTANTLVAKSYCHMEKQQIITSNTVFTAPADVDTIFVKAWGGGGGGGSSSSGSYVGAGGGGGAYVDGFITVVPGTGYTIIIGTAGAASSGAGAGGGNGGNTTFNSTTLVAAGGTGGAGGGTGTAGGAGGSVANSVGPPGVYSLILAGQNGGASNSSAAANGAGGASPFIGIRPDGINGSVSLPNTGCGGTGGANVASSAGSTGLMIIYY